MSSILDSVAMSARHRPTDIALTDGGEVLTYAGLWRESQHWIDNLAVLFGRTETVGLRMDNSSAWVLLDLALAEAKHREPANAATHRPCSVPQSAFNTDACGAFVAADAKTGIRRRTAIHATTMYGNAIAVRAVPHAGSQISLNRFIWMLARRCRTGCYVRADDASKSGSMTTSSRSFLRPSD